MQKEHILLEKAKMSILHELQKSEVIIFPNEFRIRRAEVFVWLNCPEFMRLSKQ